MNVVITGGRGFLGWHLACHLRARHGLEALRLGREDTADDEAFAAAVAGVDVVFHVAGVNRAESEAEVEQGNVDLATTLADAILSADRPVRVVFANSVQADHDSAYGRGKKRASEVLRQALDRVGGSLVDVLLPNLFGEHGRSSYNSFVATFADAVARGERPSLSGDRELPLLHAQRAAEVLCTAMRGTDHEVLRPDGEPVRISKVLELLDEFHAAYFVRGEIPALTDGFRVDLFNTYRSYLPIDHFPLHPQQFADDRGELYEGVRAHGGTGQTFVSTTRPGFTRGDHYHLRKVERFFVVRGQAKIELRRLFDDRVVALTVSGERPGFVDMPTMWVHNISNVGQDDLVTVFWSDQLLDPTDPDQYPEKVCLP